MPGSIAMDWKPDPEGRGFKKRICLNGNVSLSETEFCLHLQNSLPEEESRHLFWHFQGGQVTLGKRKFRPDCCSFRLRKIWSFDGCFQ